MPRNLKKPSLKIIETDPYLKSYEEDLNLRMERYHATKKALLGEDGTFAGFANGYLHYGFHRTGDGWIYREWAPCAESLNLIGDFNGWNPDSHPLHRTESGDWEIYIPGWDALPHLSRVKVRVWAGGQVRDRIPLYIQRTVQDAFNHDFSGQIWMPNQIFQWNDRGFRVDSAQPLCIYETHVGMAQEKEAMGTYLEFAENILPKVKAAGYTAVQLMAVMEHPYYASFGYHVSSFFAASSWFGTPDDLKKLVDTAHSMGIAVLMDIVHSHAVSNIAEGINEFDGTPHQFFHEGPRGYHDAWDSKLFNYGKHQVIHFLLSNIKFWMDEYHFDGFRFDGVTSMIYQNHGLGEAFDNYAKYFSLNTDTDAVTYLQFANELIKEVRPDAVSIAEDMSGMPGMCLPIDDGGIGFDYRLSMGIPDFWIKNMKLRDDHWNMHHMWHELTTRRPQERQIGYAESHDQALVGDKTLMFWMADKEMYSNMNKGSQSIAVDRAVSLHKMIRFITLTLACDGYLNFMGNEFGHPEWIDFPREGNGWSFQHCRRQWSLSEDPFLRYEDLYRFDREMLNFSKESDLLGSHQPQNLWMDEKRKLLAYKKNGLVFLFNFHPTSSFENFHLPIHEHGDFKVVFDTDEFRFGGQGRISHDARYPSEKLVNHPGKNGITIYTPSRTAMVLKKV